MCYRFFLLFSWFLHEAARGPRKPMSVGCGGVEVQRFGGGSCVPPTSHPAQFPGCDIFFLVFRPAAFFFGLVALLALRTHLHAVCRCFGVPEYAPFPWKLKSSCRHHMIEGDPNNVEIRSSYVLAV